MVDIPIAILPDIDFIFYMLTGVNVAFVVSMIYMIFLTRGKGAGPPIIQKLLESQMRTAESLEIFGRGMDEHMKLIGGLQDTVSAMREETLLRQQMLGLHLDKTKQKESVIVERETSKIPKLSEKLEDIYESSLSKEKSVLIKLLHDIEKYMSKLEGNVKEQGFIDTNYLTKLQNEIAYLELRVRYYNLRREILMPKNVN